MVYGVKRTILEADLEARRRRAGEMVLESEMVAPSLKDQEVEVAPNRIVARVEDYVLSGKEDGDEGAYWPVGRRAGEVRSLKRRVNDLATEKDDLSSMGTVGGLTHLLLLAMAGIERRG